VKVPNLKETIRFIFNEEPIMYDLLIFNGKIISGTGNPWYYGDVGILKGKIVKIGHLSQEKAKQKIDARGYYVSPGFIDGHSHSDLFILAHPQAEQKVMQGVTTENVGLDGLSVAPIDEAHIRDWQKNLAGLAGDLDIKWTWRSFGNYLDAVDARNPSINITSYVGLGTIRLKVMGMTDRRATSTEIDKMMQLAAQAMEEGARGISSGLIYPPCPYQTVEEVVAIAKVVRKFDGIYNVHIRTEGDTVLDSMEEVIEIGRQARIPVVITHHKVVGMRNWGLSEKTLKKVDNARREGLDVTVEQYPYTAGSTMLHAVIPPWFHAEGPDKLIHRLQTDGSRIKKDIEERTDWENFVDLIGWKNIIVSSVSTAANKKYEGNSIVEIAALRDLDDPADAAFKILAEENLAVGMVLFLTDEKDIVRIMQHPTVNFITDGLLGGGKPHPRVYGSYPRILGRYVREKGILSLEEAIRKMTSLPAEKLRLKRKGCIAENYDADLTIFDANAIIDRGTYKNPKQFPSGIEWVIVNGEVVVEKGSHTGARPGRTIRTR
jgi:N-acyl-D-amino-acid deacylase